jgi:hypothetical protein
MSAQGAEIFEGIKTADDLALSRWHKTWSPHTWMGPGGALRTDAPRTAVEKAYFYAGKYSALKTNIVINLPGKKSHSDQKKIARDVFHKSMREIRAMQEELRAYSEESLML